MVGMTASSLKASENAVLTSVADTAPHVSFVPYNQLAAMVCPGPDCIGNA